MTNVETIQSLYASFAKRDFPAVFALFDPALEIRHTRELPWGGEYHGHDGAREFFRKIAEKYQAAPQPEEYIEAGDTVVMVGRLRGKTLAGERPIDLRVVHLWTLRDGRIVRYEPFMDTPAMKELIW